MKLGEDSILVRLHGALYEPTMAINLALILRNMHTVASRKRIEGQGRGVRVL